MNENDKEIIPPTKDTEKTENTETDLEVEIELDETDDVEALKKQVQTLSAQKDHWKTKATKKPEVEVKKEIAKDDKAPQGDLSQTDVFALVKANVSEEDIPEIVDYAKLKGISVSAALKSSVVKTILSEKQEERNTANAANTSKAKASNSKVSTETIMDNASRGELPEKDEDIMRLVRARKGLK